MNKKLLYSSIAFVSMIATAAYADPDPKAGVLTTQRYVDDGLAYVYGVANNAQTDVDDLADIVNGHAADPEHGIQASSGLVGDVTNLQTDVGDIQTALSDGNGDLINVSTLKNTVGNNSSGLVKDVNDVKNALSDGNGGLINVGQLKNTVDTLDSLSTDDLEENKTYVLKTDANGEGSWSELETVNSWDPTFLTNP